MKKILFTFILLSALFITSCTTTPASKPLYYWSTYETATFHQLKNADKASQQELLAVYETIINGQKEDNTLRQTVPPGICADYGYMLIEMGKEKEGKALLQKEIDLYPESKVFISRVQEMIKK